MRSSSTSSGMTSVAPARSPACQASHIGRSTSPRPIHSWNAAYTGTFRYSATMRRPIARTVSRSVVGSTKMRAATSLPSPTMGATVFTSSAESQLTIAPSAARPASRNIPSRNAATRIGGGSARRMPSRKPFTVNVSYSAVTFSPASAARRKRTVSRTCWYGCSNGMPFHRSTMTLLDEPPPRTARPGAMSASVAIDCARSAGPRVYTGTIAWPRRRLGAHTAARVSGVNASVPLVSADHTSVKPSASISTNHYLWSMSGTPASGMVSPQRWVTVIGDLLLRRRAGSRSPFHVRRFLAPVAHDGGLAGGPEQPAVLGPEVDEPVAEPVGDGVHPDVGQDPLGLRPADHPKRVVEAVAAGALTEGLRDAEGHVVAHDRERGRVEIEQTGQAHPERAPTGSGGAVELVEAAGVGHP